MKISTVTSINSINKIRSCTVPKKSIAQTNSRGIIKGDVCQANYNAAFCGIFDKSSLRYIHTDTPLKPKKEYIISEDASLYLGDCAVDLTQPEIKERIHNLKIGEEFYLGSESKELTPQNSNMERKHIKLSGDKEGNLLVTDLNSRYGTIVKANVIEPAISDDAPIELIPDINYNFPANSCIQMGEDIYIKIGDIIPYLKDNVPYIIGKSKECDLITDNFETVENKHLSLEKRDKKIYVKDLHSKSGSRFCGFDEAKYTIPEDYTYILAPSILEENVRTIIPDNCQLMLGDNYTIDLRDSNLRNLLNEKETITAGTDSNCDIKINKINKYISGKQLILRKYEDEITATAINTDNSDVIVIPQNCIKPFPNGVSNVKILSNNAEDNSFASALYALSQLYYGQLYIKNMVQIDSEGKYTVKFNKHEPIIITPSELSEEPISADTGIKAIKYGLNIKYPQKELNPADVLKIIAGINCNTYDIKSLNKKKLLKELADNGKMNITICQAKEHGTYGPNHQFTNSKFSIKANNSYVINKVNKENKTIEVIDAQNRGEIKELNWWEFPLCFDKIYTTSELKNS